MTVEIGTLSTRYSGQRECSVFDGLAEVDGYWQLVVWKGAEGRGGGKGSDVLVGLVVVQPYAET